MCLSTIARVPDRRLRAQRPYRAASPGHIERAAAAVVTVVASIAADAVHSAAAAKPAVDLR